MRCQNKWLGCWVIALRQINTACTPSAAAVLRSADAEGNPDIEDTCSRRKSSPTWPFPGETANSPIYRKTDAVLYNPEATRSW